MFLLKILLLFLYILFLVLFFLFYPKLENFSYQSPFPKLIFVYWEGPVTDLVHSCIYRIKQINKDWTVHILNKKHYLSLTNHFKQKTYPSCRSDLIRLFYLEKYGGLWLDATIINLLPVSRWLSLIQETHNLKYEQDLLIGYSYPGEDRIMESWLFYCSPNCSFLTLWKNEFLYALSIGFRRYCQIHKKFYENKFPNNPLFLPYLTIHLCFSVVKYRNQYKTKIILLPSCEGPYHYLSSHNWNQEKAVNSLMIKDTLPQKDKFFIKIRQTERKLIQSLSPYDFEKNSILYNLYFS